MHFPRHGSAAMRSLVAVLVLLLESGKLSTSGAPAEIMQISEAANIKVPGDETPERRELSSGQLNLPQEVGAGSAMNSQGLGEVDKGSQGE